MNKTLKFSPELVELIICGKKTSTWQIFDEKNLQPNDLVTFIKRPALKPFAEATITQVHTKPLKRLTEEDKMGHETFPTNKAMYQIYSKYYNRTITPETDVKIVKFKVLKFL